MNDLNPYYTWRDDLKTGDCLLYSSRSVIGWLIRLFSRATVNHAGLVIRLAEFGDLKDRRFTLEALEYGIVLRLLSKRLEKYSGKVWWYALKPEFDEARDAIAEWALLNVGTKYDYGSLFRQAFMRVSVNAKKFFCSEYVFAAWDFAGIAPRRDHAPRPGDIPALELFNEPIQIL